MWRWMFSTTTIASSTRMPIEKSARTTTTRLIVKAIGPRQREQPVGQPRISRRAPTTIASRQPTVSHTSSTTEAVANISFWMKLQSLVVRVSP